MSANRSLRWCPGGTIPRARALRPAASVVLVNEFTSYTVCLIRLRSESISQLRNCGPAPAARPRPRGHRRVDIARPSWRRAFSPHARSVTTLPSYSIKRKTLRQRLGRISVSDESHGRHRPQACHGLPEARTMVRASRRGYEIRHTMQAGLRVRLQAWQPTSADNPQRARDRRELNELALADVLPIDLKGDRPIGAER